MTQKEKVIIAINNCDFDRLDELLDDEISYQDVPKSIFLSQLKNEIEKRRINKFDTIIKGGECRGCEVGCPVIRFQKEKDDDLGCYYVFDLIIKGNESIEDIKSCASSGFEDDPNTIFEIYLLFYNEQHLDFKPTSEYLNDKENIDLALNELNVFKKDRKLNLIDYFKWFEKHKSTIELEDDLLGPNNFELYWKLNSHYLNEIYTLKGIYSEIVISNSNFSKIKKDFELKSWYDDNEFLNQNLSNFQFNENLDAICSFNISNNETINLDISGFEEITKFKKNYNVATQNINS